VVVVAARDASPGDAGPSLHTNKEQEPNDSIAQAGTLQLGHVVEGYLNARGHKTADVDVFKLLIEPAQLGCEDALAGGTAGAGSRAPGAGRLALEAPKAGRPVPEAGRPAPEAPRPSSPQVQLPGLAGQAASQPSTEASLKPCRGVVAIRLTGVPDADLVLDVLDDRGHAVLTVNSGRSSEGEVIPNLSVSPGAYFIRVRQLLRFKGRTLLAPPRVNEQTPYRLSVVLTDARPSDEREPNGKLEWASDLVPGTETAGFLGWRKDEDWYRLNVPTDPQNARLRIELKLPPDVSARMELVDSVGSKLAHAEGGRGDRLVLRNIALKGTDPLFLVVQALSGFDAENRYLLRALLEIPAEPLEVEPNDDEKHATVLEGTQGSVAGHIAAPGDVDFYRVATPGRFVGKIVVTCPERLDIRLSLHDGASRELMKADTAGRREAEVLVGAPLSEGIFLRVSAKRGEASPDEAYRLTYTLEPDDGTWEREPNGTLESATPWPEGKNMVRGFVYPRGDIDIFRVAGPTEREQRLRVTLGPLPGLVLRLRLLEQVTGGAPRSVQEVAAQGSEAHLQATLQPGKQYFLEVRGDTGTKANSRDPYTLSRTLE